MPRARLLSDEEVDAGLQSLPGWERRGDRIVKTFRFRDFREAVAFVQRLVEPSDEQDHHPDVAIHWDRVELSLWTHASGGLTGRDLRLAATIEELTAR